MVPVCYWPLTLQSNVSMSIYTVLWRKLQPLIEVILVFLEPLIANFFKIKTKMVNSVSGLAHGHKLKQNIDWRSQTRNTVQKK